MNEPTPAAPPDPAAILAAKQLLRDAGYSVSEPARTTETQGYWMAGYTPERSATLLRAAGLDPAAIHAALHATAAFGALVYDYPIWPDAQAQLVAAFFYQWMSGSPVTTPPS